MANTPASVYDVYLKAFNAGDIEATLACYEPQASFVTNSGRIARGSAEVRTVFNRIFRNKPKMKVEIRRIIPGGDDLALVIVQWKTTTDAKSGSGTATDILRRQHDGTWKIVLDNPYGISEST